MGRTFRLWILSVVVITLGTAGACLPESDDVNMSAGGTGGRSAGGTGGGSGGSGTGSCGGVSGTSDLATWANLRDVIENGCYGADCHREGEREPVLLGVSGALSDGPLYEKLTNYKTEKCGKRVLVKPCAPNDSAFYLAQTGMCGDVPQMPFGCLPEFENCTPADKLEGIRQWIANGARRP